MARGTMYRVNYFGGQVLQDIWTGAQEEVAGDIKRREELAKRYVDQQKVTADLAERYRVRESNDQMVKYLVEKAGVSQAAGKAAVALADSGADVSWAKALNAATPWNVAVASEIESIKNLALKEPAKAGLYKTQLLDAIEASALPAEAKTQARGALLAGTTGVKEATAAKVVAEARAKGAFPGLNERDSAIMLQALEDSSPSGITGGPEARAWRDTLKDDERKLLEGYVRGLMDDGQVSDQEVPDREAAAKLYAEAQQRGAFPRNQAQFYSPDYIQALQAQGKIKGELANPLFEGRSAREEALKRYSNRGQFVQGQRGILAPKPNIYKPTIEDEANLLRSSGKSDAAVQAYVMAKEILRGGKIGATTRERQIVDKMLVANPDITAKDLDDALKRAGASDAALLDSRAYFVAKTLPPAPPKDARATGVMARGAEKLNRGLMDAQTGAAVKGLPRREAAAKRTGMQPPPRSAEDIFRGRRPDLSSLPETPDRSPKEVADAYSAGMESQRARILEDRALDYLDNLSPEDAADLPEDRLANLMDLADKARARKGVK